MTGETGYIYDPEHVARVIQERTERGDKIYASTFDAGKDSQLVGAWERMKARGVTGMFLRDREIVLIGGYRRPFMQKRGTCVSRGMCRGVQVSLDVSIADNQELLRAVEISFAPIYSLARNEVGHGRCGNKDGAILADAAKAVHDYGVMESELFGSLPEDQIEALACRYAAPGMKTPKEWIDASTGHVAATFMPDSLGLLFDCIAAGYAVPYAHGYVTGSPNNSGISDLGTYSPHCRCFTGVFVDEHGEDQLESSESWGRFPAGQPKAQDQTMPLDQIPRVLLRYAGGEKRLAPGNVGIKAKRFWDEIKSGGEAWSVGAPNFRAQSLSSLQFNSRMV